MIGEIALAMSVLVNIGLLVENRGLNRLLDQVHRRLEASEHQRIAKAGQADQYDRLWRRVAKEHHHVFRQNLALRKRMSYLWRRVHKAEEKCFSMVQ